MIDWSDVVPMVVLTADDERHEQLTVRGVDVDTLIAPLLQAVWDYGFETQFSCQGNPLHHAIMPTATSEAYILFTRRDDAYAFQCRTAEMLGDDWQAIMRINVHLATDDRASVTFPPHLLNVITDRWLGI